MLLWLKRIRDRILYTPLFENKRAAKPMLIGLVAVILVYCIVYSTSRHVYLDSSLTASDAVVSFTPFSQLPMKLFYFRNSNVVLMAERVTGKLWRSDDQGKSWSLMSSIPEGLVHDMILHPYDQEHSVLILGKKNVHYISHNQGETWTLFETSNLTPDKMSFSFHSQSPEKILFVGQECDKGICHENLYYTLDGFKGPPKRALTYVRSCVWTVNANPSISVDSILCNEWPDELKAGDASFKDPRKLRLVSSDSFFASKHAIIFSGGITGLSIVNTFILCVLQVDTSEGNQLLVSKDGKTFVKAVFPESIGLRQQGFTILESSEASLSVDILTSNSSSAFPPRYGTLYFSDDKGSHFVKSLDHTNRAPSSLVDFETIQSYYYNGILLANVVDNYQDFIQKDLSEEDKKLVSKISFDHGSRWDYLKRPDKNCGGKTYDCNPSECHLHLHSVTRAHNMGKVFSTTSAPGFVLGVGSIGSYLSTYTRSDTFMSMDGGASWTCIAKGPHKYEVADHGSLILLIPDSETPQDSFLFSTNAGKTWKKQGLLLNSKKWVPGLTLLDSYSTSQKILMFATDVNNIESGWMVHFDFSKVLSRQCQFDSKNPKMSSDIESWSPRSLDSNSKCLLGESLVFYRKKADANCYIGQEFVLADVASTPCECTVNDYECDVNFVKNSQNECVPTSFVKDEPVGCKQGEKYSARSGYRKVPGNKCRGGLSLDSRQEKECTGRGKAPSDGSAPISFSQISQSAIIQAHFVPDSFAVFLRLENGTILYSKDEGESWTKMDFTVKITGMDANIIDPNRVFFFSESAVYIVNQAQSDSKYQELSVPKRPNQYQVPVFDFHPTQKNWFVFVGDDDNCTSLCHTTAFMTKNNGQDWKEVDTFVEKCVWALDIHFMTHSLNEDSIYCLSYMKKNAKSQDELRFDSDSDNFLQMVLFNHEKNVLLDKGANQFFVSSNILVVAAREQKNTILYVSFNGTNLSSATFPPYVHLEASSFTILPTYSDGIFIDVGEASLSSGSKVTGSLFKSNQQGQLFSKILDGTSRDGNGRVDFENVRGIEGILLVNSIENPTDAPSMHRIQSVISLDDGSTWKELEAPLVDANKAEYPSCSSTSCRLHLHSHTTIPSSRSFISNLGSPGLLIALGNVGQKLDSYSDSNVYISRDAGATWAEMLKGPHKWVLLDYGNIIALVRDKEPTNKVIYSWDFGDSFSEYEFSTEKIQIENMVTRPNSSSFSLMLDAPDSKNQYQLYTIDFSKILRTKCSQGKDLEKWVPFLGNNKCFLGTVLEFTRRKKESHCYFGEKMSMESSQSTCPCSQLDYECDFGFYRNALGECILEGKDPNEPLGCRKGEEYLGSSGYKKIGLSKCAEGLDMTRQVQRVCGRDYHVGDVGVTVNTFDGTLQDFYYFNSTGTLVLLDSFKKVWQSEDEGSVFKTLFNGQAIQSIYMDPHRGKRAFFLSMEKSLWMTADAGKTYHSISLPVKGFTEIIPEYLSTHAEKENWLLYTGGDKCEVSQTGCLTQTYVSWDTGTTWTLVRKNARKCVWAKTGHFSPKVDSLVVCLQLEPNRDPRQFIKAFEQTLVKSVDPKLALDSFQTLFKSSGFAILEHYMIAIQLGDADQVLVSASLDGQEWSVGQFPSEFRLPNYGFTVLDSSNGNIYLQVLMNTNIKYGTLFKSNWNGTFYKLLLDHVHQDRNGNVDFEKVTGIPGISVANLLVNSTSGIITKMSFDDGDSWNSLQPPAKDSRGISYTCPDCNLHLHAFTERHDKRDQYSFASAIGVLVAVGNVGPSLTDFNQGRTFMSRNAGQSWIELDYDAYMYEIGDSGSLLLLVNDETPTDSVKYSINHGQDFRELKLSNKIGNGKFKISNILTESSGTTSHFVLLGTVKGGTMEGKIVSIHLDFTDIWSRSCILDPTDSLKSDYEKLNILNETCHFGQKTYYYARKANADCKVNQLYSLPKMEIVPCGCTHQDFECDYNFIQNSDGKCVLVSSLSPKEPECINGVLSLTQGYRKKQSSGCRGGLEKELAPKLEPCASLFGTKPTSWMPYILFFSCLTVLACLLLVYKKSKRHGNIHLGQQEHSYPVLNVLYQIGMICGEWIMDKMAECTNFIASRWNRSNGYSRVQSIPRPSYDIHPFADDSTLLDLDEY